MLAGGLHDGLYAVGAAAVATTAVLTAALRVGLACVVARARALAGHQVGALAGLLR